MALKKKPSDLFVKAVVNDLKQGNRNKAETPDATDIIPSSTRSTATREVPSPITLRDAPRNSDGGGAGSRGSSGDQKPEAKVSFGSRSPQAQGGGFGVGGVGQDVGQGSSSSSSGLRAPVFRSGESSLYHAESLQIAQTKILELEKEIEKLRRENEMLTSASEIAKQRAEEFFVKLQSLERSRSEDYDQFQVELKIYKDTIAEKDKDLIRYRLKIDELETRLAADLKKIRVRERDLENRLELSKMERVALLRAKDEAILDLKKRVEELHSELQAYKNRYQELNIKMDTNHEQLSRTVKALRLALTHLEAQDVGSEDR